jgi:TatA/E family protein of Tat protein translocase
MLLGEIFGPDLLIVVILVAVLIFGGAAIPKLARSLGQAKNEFEKGLGSVKATSDAITNAASIPELKIQGSTK